MKTFLSYVIEHTSEVRFSELEYDMQVLIGQLYEIHQQYRELERLESGDTTMQVQEWDVDRFPEVPIADDPFDNRDEAYALEIPTNQHPVLVVGHEWLDGRHRVWALRQKGIRKVRVIDLGQYGLQPQKGLGTIRV